MIASDDRPPPRRRTITRWLEIAYIAMCLAVLILFLVLIAIGVIPLWLLFPRR